MISSRYTEMAQDRGSVAPRVDMVEAETTGIRRRQVQLTAQISQALGAGIILARREATMGAEEPKLEGDPDPADEVESFDECDVVDVQAPGLDERSIRHTRLPQPQILRSLNQWTTGVNTSRVR